MAHSIVLIVTGVSGMFSVHDASHGAGQMRPVNLGEIVGAVQIARGFLPVAAIDQIIPVGDLVVDRATVVAIGNAAIHAARRLIARRFLAQGQHELAIVANAIGRRRDLAPVRAIDFASSESPSPCP
jgi:stage V sporulation protein SpoVS